MKISGATILEYTPEDMTVTVEAGMLLDALQAALAQHKQWLPIDPPQPRPLSIANLIDSNVSGPRRFACGTIRDHLIGITVELADGKMIHSGGKVVKNVAGYDLLKLFVGAKGSLGTVREATFKLRPLPEAESFVATVCESPEQADEAIEQILKSPITPVVLDLHNLDGAKKLNIVLSFAGSKEEVDWQLNEARQLGFNHPANLEYATKFWSGENLDKINRLSVLPSKTAPAIRSLKGEPFVARAGNGIIYHLGTQVNHKDSLPLELMHRVKDAYDPGHRLPEFAT